MNVQQMPGSLMQHYPTHTKASAYLMGARDDCLVFSLSDQVASNDSFVAATRPHCRSLPTTQDMYQVPLPRVQSLRGVQGELLAQSQIRLLELHRALTQRAHQAGLSDEDLLVANSNLEHQLEASRQQCKSCDEYAPLRLSPLPFLLLLSPCQSWTLSTACSDEDVAIAMPNMVKEHQGSD